MHTFMPMLCTDFLSSFFFVMESQRWKCFKKVLKQCNFHSLFEYRISEKKSAAFLFILIKAIFTHPSHTHLELCTRKKMRISIGNNTSIIIENN